MDENRLIKRNLYFLLVSIVICCINLFVITPISGKFDAFSEGGSMTLIGRIIVFAINAHILVIYSIYSWKFYRKLKYFNFLNYPLTLLNIGIFALNTFLSIVGYVAWVWFLIRPMLEFGIFVLSSIFYGLILDIKAWIKYIKIKKSQ